MQFYIHLAIAILLTLYFIYSFIKEHRVYQFIFILWVPSTLLVYPANGNQTLSWMLSIAQIIMFILVVFFLFKKKPADKKNIMDTINEMTDTSEKSADSADLSQETDAEAEADGEIKDK